MSGIHKPVGDRPFNLIAIIIDRRSFLIAAIGYIVALAGTVFDGEGAAMTTLLLGSVFMQAVTFVAVVILSLLWATSGGPGVVVAGN